MVENMAWLRGYRSEEGGIVSLDLEFGRGEVMMVTGEALDQGRPGRDLVGHRLVS